MEANSASSRKDFKNKINISKKEAQETKHWLRMIIRCLPNEGKQAKILWQESHELTLILQSISAKIK